MYTRKIIGLYLIVLSGTLSAQMREGNYQAFKNSKDETVETVSVNVVPLGNGVMHFHEGDPRKPLNGSYRIMFNRREYYTGNFKKGIVDGDWERYYQDEIRDKFFYTNGRLDGKAIRFRQKGGEEFVYTYKNGLKQHYVSYHPDGKKEEESFYDTDGRLHGKMFAYDTGGNVKAEKNYQHGKRHGKQMETNREGFKISQEYVNNTKVGDYSKLYPNGNICEKGTYDPNGEKTGKWIYGNEEGSMKMEEHYLNNQLNGEKRIYFTGEKLKSTEEYIDGKLHGKKVEYDEETYRISREVMYANGKLHGAFKVFHNGILWREGAYQDGKIIYEKEYADGKLQIVKLLDETGALVNVEKYDNSGKKTYNNANYKKHSSVKLKENASGVIDVEIE